MVQYEDQGIEIDSPYSLSRFHSFTRTCVSVCVCVFLCKLSTRVGSGKHCHNQDTECAITTKNLHYPFAPSHS